MTENVCEHRQSTNEQRSLAMRFNNFMLCVSDNLTTTLLTTVNLETLEDFGSEQHIFL